jgi:ADP-ribose pyrophosphatase YjhB (NUDIX family)
MPGPAHRRKAFAYITSGRRILLLAHPDHPEAGIQVPAGTMRPGESAERAALREATEETGLVNLELVRVLGEQEFDMRPFGRDEIHHRTFVHMRCEVTTPDAWDHWETDPDGSPGERIRFTLFWASLDAPLPDLIADHSAFIADHGTFIQELRAAECHTPARQSYRSPPPGR